MAAEMSFLVIESKRIFFGKNSRMRPFMFSLAPPHVTADSNLISFRRLYRSAIDHHRQSTDARKYAFGTGGQFWGGGNTRVCRAVEAMFLCGNFFCPHGEYFRIAYFIKNVWKVKPILFQRFVELFAIRKRTAPRNNTPANPLGR